MRRKRPVGKNIYSIEYLLDKQTKSFTRDRNYVQLISYYRASPALQRIKFNKRCYSLLNHAVIQPEHLENFYRTYKLPRDPFFPLFFMIKRSYLAGREEKKSERQHYIRSGMEKLSPSVKKMMSLTGDLESVYHRACKTPLFRNYLYPGTKKQVDLYSRFTHPDWFLYFRRHFIRLQQQYERLSPEKSDQLLACFILDCLPDKYSDHPDKSLIKRQYRSYSKIYHPDAGGDHKLFLEIKWAHDILLGENKH
jgi:hypothetical protein